MAMKGSGEATEWKQVGESESSVSWIAYPDERMQRASHALTLDGDIWLIDPVDVPELDAFLAEFGTVRGVVLLLDRHKRDCAEIANRHGVSVWVPDFIDGVADKLDAPVERFRHELADTGFLMDTLTDTRFWQEAFLWNEQRGVLVVPEAVGTSEYFLAGDERLGVHPMLRLLPPRKLARFEPEQILVGHGVGVYDQATAALLDAVSGSRARAPRLAAQTMRSVLPF